MRFPQMSKALASSSTVRPEFVHVAKAESVDTAMRLDDFPNGIEDYVHRIGR